MLRRIIAGDSSLRAFRRLRDNAGLFSRIVRAPACIVGAAHLDIGYYRQREQAERALAQQAFDEAARASHLGLADRYRDLILAYQRIARDDPGSSSAA